MRDKAGKMWGKPGEKKEVGEEQGKEEKTHRVAFVACLIDEQIPWLLLLNLHNFGIANPLLLLDLHMA